jgi:hypothetical protein
MPLRDGSMCMLTSASGQKPETLDASIELHQTDFHGP